MIEIRTVGKTHFLNESAKVLLIEDVSDELSARCRIHVVIEGIVNVLVVEMDSTELNLLLEEKKRTDNSDK
jgi:hypothetical protein